MESKKHNFFNPSIFASFVGGSITALLMTPLDVVKIRMQSKYILSQNYSHSCFIYCNGLMDHLCTCVFIKSTNGLQKSKRWFERPIFTSKNALLNCSQSQNSSTCIVHPAKYSPRNSLEALISIARTEGILSLWSGLSPTLFMALPGTIIYYTVQDWLKETTNFNSWLLMRKNRELYQGDKIEALHFIPSIAGGAARIVAVCCVSPIELIRTKMQSKPFSISEIYQITRDSTKHHGLRQLWIGMGPTLLRDVPYSMIFWTSIEAGRYHFLKKNPHDPQSAYISFRQMFFIGVVSGFLSGLFTHPFDVIKTHRQLELGDAIATNKHYNHSTIKSLKLLYSKEGFKALFSGFTPRLIKTSMASAIMISTYETLKGYLEQN